MFSSLPTFRRKDLFSASRYAQWLDNTVHVRDFLRAEHLESTGEHNSIDIARTLGSVLYDGSAYSSAGFNTYGTYKSNPAVGTVTVQVTSGLFQKDAAALMLQNASGRGDGVPCLSWAEWTSDILVTVYSTYWSGTLGSTLDAHWQTATGEDASFHLGVHGPRLANGAQGSTGGSLTRANGLRAGTGATYFNQLVQEGATLQTRMDFAHRAGVHNCREISKAWAHVAWDGTVFNVSEQEATSTFDGVQVASLVSPSAGILDVGFLGTLATTNYQVFVDVDYSRSVGSSSDYFIITAPYDERGRGGFRLYLYKKFTSAGVEYWDRSSACDFYVHIYDDH